jgi:signal transduction protein with GAF and PtsI domain
MLFSLLREPRLRVMTSCHRHCHRYQGVITPGGDMRTDIRLVFRLPVGEISVPSSLPAIHFKEAEMNKQLINYETLLNVTKAMSKSRDPEEIVLLTVRSTKQAMNLKGCALFLINPQTHQLEVAASEGLSDDYLNKGPVSSLRSIAASLEDGPVAIYDVSDDPRIQYPEAAKNEGIASILSVPIYAGGAIIGAMRVYTESKWEFTLDDVNFVQALAQIAGIMVDMCRLYQGQQEYIDVLTTMRDARDM